MINPKRETITLVNPKDPNDIAICNVDEPAVIALHKSAGRSRIIGESGGVDEVEPSDEEGDEEGNEDDDE